MAGHSHFKNIMRRKGGQDAKRAKIFTKIAREIIVAARSGPDINFNARLRTIVIKARQAGLPKDRIEASIKKGSGTGETENYDYVRYEGYGPGGVAIIIEALTDNRNRTASDIRSAFTKNGGNMGESGSVAFMFEHVAVIEYPAANIVEDTMLEAAIEAGADNCETEDGIHSITTTLENMIGVKDTLTKRFGEPSSAKMVWQAKITAPVNDASELMDLVEILEDNDDVQEVFTNADLSAEAEQKLSA
jgi:YebC/PmpR family DNA-binding regulatory protein